MKRITPSKMKELYEALHYLHVPELKEICEQYHLSLSGLKKVLIERILLFIESGKSSLPKSFPEISKAKKGIKYPLSPQTKILEGAYKNDAVTRAFMKKLIGDYFHFTAFGQDWIKKKWAIGEPPTYAEFASFWKEEYARLKEKKAQPKEEWAYIRFVQRYAEENPLATGKQMVKAWELERKKQLQRALKILSEIEVDHA